MNPYEIMLPPSFMNSKKSVLIIDDEYEIGVLLSGTLKKSGFDVNVAHTLAAGSKIFESILPDILFLDIYLKQENGLKYIPWFKELKKDTKIIMISAFDDQSDKKTATQLGADNFLSKPFNIAEVSAILHKLL